VIVTADPSAVLAADKTRELVAQYQSRATFESAVAALISDGFDRTDLSVLASHDSLEVAGDVAGYHREDGGELVAALGQQSSWLEPMAIAGALFAVAGPVGAAAAAIIAGTAGAVALRPLLDEITESAHAGDFAAAADAGHILLWVRAAGAERVARAEAVLSRTGGSGIVRLAVPGREDEAIA
jgi:hypothetical protein